MKLFNLWQLIEPKTILPKLAPTNNCYQNINFFFKPRSIFCLFFKTSTNNMHYNVFSIVQLPMCTWKTALTIFPFVYFNIHLAGNLHMNFDVFTYHIHIFVFFLKFKIYLIILFISLNSFSSFWFLGILSTAIWIVVLSLPLMWF